MAAYRTAARLFPGLAAPMVGLGIEYVRLSNFQLAEHMLDSAAA
jgi:anaphase-promoting complex subunit 6